MSQVPATEGPRFDPAETADWWLAPDRLFDGQQIHSGMALHIADGRVTELRPTRQIPADASAIWHSPMLAAPGYFDVQVNGGGGVLLNSDPTPKGLLAIAAAHREMGTTSCLPTLITDAPEVMERTADAILQVCGQGGVAGLHLEGPHISIERRGAHKTAFIRPFDDHTFNIALRLRAAAVPLMLTVAPEAMAPGQIARLVRAGVVVSLGHTASDAAGVTAAIAEGAQSATHLFNAMTPMASRAPGVVGARIDSTLYCGFIADGYHVDDTMLKIAIRARPRGGRMVLVSDAMPTVNGPDSFTLYGETIRLKDGVLVNQAGSLAGVHIDMAGSVRRLVDVLQLPEAEVLAMATSVPASLMGLSDQIGGLSTGVQADIVLLDPKMVAAQVLIGGRPFGHI